MHSSTQSYVALQALYKQQHLDDLAKFSQLLASVLQGIGLPADAVPEQEVHAFVKNVGGVGIMKGSCLLEAKTYEGRMKERISESKWCWLGFTADMIAEDFSFEAEPEHGICVVLAVLASEEFFKVFGRWPGQGDDDVDADVAEVERLAMKAITTVHMEGGDVPDELTNAIGEV